MFKMQSLCTVGLLVASLVSLSALEATAAPKGSAGSNPNSTSPALCGSGTVTAFGLGSYTNCIGAFEGNDVTNGAAGGGDDPLLDQLSTGIFGGITNWSLLEKVNKPGAGSKLSWTETSEGVGTWQVSSPITRSFVLSLKAGNFWSAYYFNNSSATEVTNGLWNTLGVDLAGNGINGKALSHASIFIAPGDDQVEVPEPTTLAALGLVAVAGLGTLKRQNRAKAN